MTQAAVFAHHDRIAGAATGAILMVCEPIMIQRMPPGNMVSAAPGLWLRVKFYAGGGLWCEAALDGGVTTVVVNAEDFGSLDFEGMTERAYTVAEIDRDAEDAP